VKPLRSPGLIKVRTTNFNQDGAAVQVRVAGLIASRRN